MKSGYIFLLVLLFPFYALAQDTGTLTGQVTGMTDGAPLPGANVGIPELPNKGAATDVNGSYTIEGIPVGTHEVVVRFVGYREATATITIRAGGKTTQNFALEDDFLNMDEIVVTGQGASVEKRRLSSDVSVLNIREIESAPVTSVDQLLQGRVPGATVRAQSAQPGQGMNINFRGITSAFASQTPVIYVDGVRVDNRSSTSLSNGGEETSALSELLTSDIERIEITKGGAASTLYGSDAANGVIQIFTKRGISGDPIVTFRTDQGVDFADTKFVQDTGFSFPDQVNDPSHPDFGKTSFIEDEFLQSSHYQNYYASISGGVQDLTYHVSGRIQDTEGIQPNNSNTLYSLRGNVQANLSDKVGVSFIGSYTRSNFQRLNNGTAIADPYTSFQVGDAYFFSGADNFDEALRRFLLPSIKEGVNRFTIASTATYRPSALFYSKLTAGVDSRYNEQRNLEPAEFDIIGGNESGLIERFNRDYSVVTLEYVGTINYPREGTVTSSFTFGAQGFREETSIVEATGETFGLPGTEDIGEAGNISADENRSQVFNGGFYFKEQVGLYDRVFVDAGIRFDGNSAFGENIGLQAYPSVGVAYSLSEESFWGSSFGNVWNELKLRASYGQTGKFPDPFSRDFTFQSSAFRGESSPRFDNPGNLNLKPEKTSTFEVGLETSVLSERLALNFTYYTSTTEDALFFVPEQPSTGRGVQLRNIGEIENEGIELSMDARLITTQAVDWWFGMNYSWFRNEVTDMGGAADFNIGGSSVRARQRISEGHPIGEWMPTVPIDTNGDGLLDGSEFQFIGATPYPTQTGAFTTSVTFYRRLTISALADWALDAKIFDWSSHWASFNGLERSVLPTRYDTDGNEVGNYSTTAAGSFLLKDGDYIKLREISATYELPRSFTSQLKLRGASIFVTARNLFTLSRQDLVDPELAGVSSNSDATENVNGLELGGEQSSTLSVPHQFRLGIQVQF